MRRNAIREASAGVAVRDCELNVKFFRAAVMPPFFDRRYRSRNQELNHSILITAAAKC